jgi:thymidylate kinase
MFTIGIEGLIKAGKSTLAHFLAEVLKAKLISEYGVYTKGSAAFPKYPPTTLDEAIDAVNFFVKVERLRMNDFYSDNGIVILDRTYLTCVAFDYAASHFTGFDISNESWRIWNDSPRIEPDLILFLDVSNKELDRRLTATRHVYLPHFYQPEFNFYIRRFFIDLEDRRIKKINSDQHLMIVQQEALSLLDPTFY